MLELTQCPAKPNAHLVTQDAAFVTHTQMLHTHTHILPSNTQSQLFSSHMCSETQSEDQMFQNPTITNPLPDENIVWMCVCVCATERDTESESWPRPSRKVH